MDLQEFLKLNWSDAMRQKLKRIALDPKTIAISANKRDDKYYATVWQEMPVNFPPATHSVWIKPDDVSSRTQKALKLVREGQTAYQAAKALGISPTAIYRAQKRMQNRPVCECCGQVIRQAL